MNQVLSQRVHELRLCISVFGVSCAVLCRTYEHGKDVRRGDADRRQKQRLSSVDVPIGGIVELKRRGIHEPGSAEWGHPFN
jgi:hypothetical protein